jgi:hypothetical protein
MGNKVSGSGEIQETDISPGTASRHARLKWLKVVADVGKHDWPHDYPEFINHVEVLISEPKCFDLARLVVEEFCDDNDDVRPCLAGPDLQGVTDTACSGKKFLVLRRQ